jgi:hypothetical protein
MRIKISLNMKILILIVLIIIVGIVIKVINKKKNKEVFDDGSIQQDSMPGFGTRIEITWPRSIFENRGDWSDSSPFHDITYPMSESSENNIGVVAHPRMVSTTNEMISGGRWCVEVPISLYATNYAISLGGGAHYYDPYFRPPSSLVDIIQPPSSLVDIIRPLTIQLNTGILNSNRLGTLFNGNYYFKGRNDFIEFDFDITEEEVDDGTNTAVQALEVDGGTNPADQAREVTPIIANYHKVYKLFIRNGSSLQDTIISLCITKLSINIQTGILSETNILLRARHDIITDPYSYLYSNNLSHDSIRNFYDTVLENNNQYILTEEPQSENEYVIIYESTRKPVENYSISTYYEGVDKYTNTIFDRISNPTETPNSDPRVKNGTLKVYPVSTFSNTFNPDLTNKQNIDDIIETYEARHVIRIHRHRPK